MKPKTYTQEQVDKIKKDAFTCGFLICLSNTVNGYGCNTAEEENFRIIGKPSAKECARLGLSEYDKRAMSVCRKWTR